MIKEKLLKKGALSLIAVVSAFLVGGQVSLALGPIGPVIIPPDFVFPPFLGVVTPVPVETNDTTPSFTFSTTEAGDINYQGDCVSLTSTASSGDNTITFFELPLGLHDNCKVRVHGSTSGLDSAWLDVPAFTVTDLVIFPPLDLPPYLSVVTPVPTPTYDNTPEFVFSSTKAGTLLVTGDCSTATATAVDGNNTIIFNALPLGTHSNCKVSVTSSTGLTSTQLVVPTFKVEAAPALPPAVVAPCADFTDVNILDTDCDAISYVKSIGAMTGNPDGTFAPDGLLQRDQIAKIALETFKKFVVTSDYCGGVAPFGDVTESAWAYQYICRAKALGVVTGYLSGPDMGYFRPARTVNRSEFLAILLRNLSETMPTGASYADVPVDSWYAGYAKYSKDNNLFSGGNLYPTNFTTRREVAEIIYKLHTLGKI